MNEVKFENKIRYENISLSKTIKDLNINELLLLANGVLKNNSKDYTVEFKDGVFKLTNSKEKIVLTREQLVDNIIYSIYAIMYGSCVAVVLMDRDFDVVVDMVKHLYHGELFGIEIIDVSDLFTNAVMLSLLECGNVEPKHTKRILITKDSVYEDKNVEKALDRYKESVLKSKENYHVTLYISAGNSNCIKVRTIVIHKTPDDSYLDNSLCHEEKVHDVEEAICFLEDKLKHLPENVSELEIIVEEICPYKSYKAITDISISAIKHFPNALIKTKYVKRSTNESI